MNFSESTIEFIKKECERYETKRSAILPCLYEVQKQKGWVSPEDVTTLSQQMDLSEVWISEVLNFYTMYNKKPVGKLHIQVCNNISCCMNGSRELTTRLCDEYGVKPGEMSSDGKLTITAVECLGSCDTAPMMQVNDEYYENLTADSAIATINKLR